MKKVFALFLTLISISAYAQVELVSTGSSNAYLLAFPGVFSYSNGISVTFKSNFANTAAATINVNGLGAKSIKKEASAALVANDIKSGQVVTLVYDGTNFQMTSASGNTPGAYIAVRDSAWSLTGNGNTNITNNFIGTTNNVPLAFRVNNERVGYFDGYFSQNTFLGKNAGNLTSPGTHNFYAGQDAGAARVNRGNNIGIGLLSLSVGTTGNSNVALGAQAGQNVSGDENIYIGLTSGYRQFTTSGNTFVGSRSGTDFFYTGNFNTLLGYQTSIADGVSNSTALGYLANVAVSNAIVLGRATTGSTVNTKVGIGTTSPSLAALQVQGMVGNTSAIFSGSANSQGVAIISDWPAIHFNAYYNGGTKQMANNGYAAVIGTDQAAGGLIFSTTPTANTTIGANVAGFVNALVIKGNGYTGINTSSPGERLHVAGQVRIDTVLHAADADSVLMLSSTGVIRKRTAASLASGGGISIAVRDSAWTLTGNNNINSGTNFLGTTNNASLRFRTNNTHRMVIDSNGFVGIGTPTPISRLEIIGSNTTEWIRIQTVATGTAGFFDMYSSGTGGFNPGTTGFNNSGSPITFNIASAEKMRVNSNGRVGIGTTTPAQALHVKGQIQLDTTIHATDEDSILTITSGGVIRKRTAASLASGGGSDSQTLSFDDATHQLTISGGNTITIADLSCDSCAGGGGTLAGDVTGAIGANTVEKIRGVNVIGISPSMNQVLQYNGVSWAPSTIAGVNPSWELTGNSGTDTSANFIGTTDSMDFKLKVHNIQMGLFSENGNITLGTNNTPGSGNSTISGGLNNTITAGAGTIGGGLSNTAGIKATVGGGDHNTAANYASTVSGGDGNNAGGSWSYVGGGASNAANGYTSSGTGGVSNVASGQSSTVAGGESNIADGYYSSIGGGFSNIAPSYGEFAAGVFNKDYIPVSGSSFDASDRIFSIGNGIDNANRSNALTILKNGNMGLGNTSPTAKLHVAGTLRFDSLNAQPGYVLTAIDTAGNAEWQPGGGGGAGWSLTGNTVIGSHYIGTNNDMPLKFVVNSQQAGIVEQLNGSVYNTGLGAHVLQSNTGVQNTAFGASVLNNGNSGFGNVGVGYGVLNVNSSGSQNSALGYSALASNTTGSYNVGLGNSTLSENVTGNFNIAIGASAMYSQQGAQSTIAIGDSAMFSGGGGGQNTAVGSKALMLNSEGSNNTAIGFETLKNTYYGDGSAAKDNTAVGASALTENADGSGNTAVGSGALQSGNSSLNTAIGYQSQYSGAGFGNNTSIGAYSLYANVGGHDNTALGYYSLAALNEPNADFAEYNTAVGSSSLSSLTTGANNTAVGADAMALTTSGNGNSAFGRSALRSANTGGNNSAFGVAALANNDAGFLNIAVGNNTLNSNTDGNNNVAIGHYAIQYGSSGFSNVAMGSSALSNGGNSNNNVAVGYSAMSSYSSDFSTAVGSGALAGDAGDHNTAIGYNTLAVCSAATNNVAVGSNALASNVGGGENTSVGVSALSQNTGGANNVAMGYSALLYNTIGSNNVAIGNNAMENNQADGNTAVGHLALNFNQNGSQNVAVGRDALKFNISGVHNTALGSGAGITINSGNNNVMVGYNAISVLSGSGHTALGSEALIGFNATENTTVIGNGTYYDVSNSVRLGNAMVTTVEGPVAYTIPSDGRFKTNISAADVSGLAFITKLRPVNYNFDTRKYEEFHSKNLPDSIRRKRLAQDFTKSTNLRQTGFIAQEVEAAAKEAHYDFSGGLHVPENDNDNYSVAYSQFVVPLVKAVQELNAKVEALEKENAALKAEKTSTTIGYQTTFTKTIPVTVDDLQNQLNELRKLVEELKKK